MSSDHGHEDYDDFNYGEEPDDGRFRAFMNADERAFTGGCGNLVGTLVRECIPVFADLVDEVFANGWGEKADKIVNELAHKMLHLNEHITSGWTPVALFSHGDFFACEYVPAEGRWIVPAIKAWLSLAASEGTSGILRSRLPWVLPLALKISGESGHHTSFFVDLGIARLSESAVFLIERGEITEEDVEKLVSDISSEEQARSLSGFFTEMLFDIANDASDKLEASENDGVLSMITGENGEIALIEEGKEKYALLNDDDYIYDWGSAATLCWLILVSVQVLYREKASSTPKKSEISETELPTVDEFPLMVEVESGLYWLWPDLEDDLTLVVDPSNLYEKDEASVKDASSDAARRSGGRLKATSGKANDDDFPVEKEDEEDTEYVNRGLVSLETLTEASRIPVNVTPPLVELHQREEGIVLRGLMNPYETSGGSNVRFAFHTGDDFNSSFWPLKKAGENDHLSVQGSPAFLGDVQPGTGLAFALMADALLTTLNNLISIRMDKELECNEYWAPASLSVIKTITVLSQQGVLTLAEELLPEAKTARFNVNVFDELESVTLTAPDGGAVTVAGAELSRKDATYCDLVTLYRALSTAREMTGHIVSDLTDNDNEADTFTKEWLPEVSSNGGGLELSLDIAGNWGSRVGVASIKF